MKNLINWVILVRLLVQSLLIHHSASEGPPHVMDHKSLYNLTEGESLRLVCPVVGNPQVLIEWRKDGLSLQSNSWEERVRINEQVLRIKATLAEDSGLYSCIATNGFGTVTVTFNVVISGTTSDPGSSDMTSSSVRSRFQEPYPINISVTSGLNVSVLCKLRHEGRKAPLVNWYRLPGGLETILLQSIGPGRAPRFTDTNLQLLTSAESLSQSDNDKLLYYSVLTLVRVRPESTGWYMCACNETSDQFRSFYLLVLPSDPYNNEVRASNDFSSTLVQYSDTRGFLFLVIIISVLIVFGILLISILIIFLCRTKNRLATSRESVQKSLNSSVDNNSEMERLRVPSVRLGCEGMSAHCSPARQAEWPPEAISILHGQSSNSSSFLNSSQLSNFDNYQYSLMYRTHDGSAADLKPLGGQHGDVTGLYTKLFNPTNNSNSSLRDFRTEGDSSQYSGLCVGDYVSSVNQGNHRALYNYREQTLTYLADC